MLSCVGFEPANTAGATGLGAEERVDDVRQLASVEALAGAFDAGEGTFVLPNGRFVDHAMAGHARTIVSLGSRARTP